MVNPLSFRRYGRNETATAYTITTCDGNMIHHIGSLGELKSMYGHLNLVTNLL